LNDSRPHLPIVASKKTYGSKNEEDERHNPQSIRSHQTATILAAESQSKALFEHPETSEKQNQTDCEPEHGQRELQQTLEPIGEAVFRFIKERWLALVSAGPDKLACPHYSIL